MAGDRNFADDQAVIGGLARFSDKPIVVIGHEKGSDSFSLRSSISQKFFDSETTL